MRRRLVVAAAVASAAVAVAAVALAMSRSPSGPTRDLLPDLDAAPPGVLDGETKMVDGKPHFFLGFGSAAENVGEGPLIVEGRRRGSSMRARQLVRRSDGSTRAIEGIGVIRYAVSEDHQHWHFLGFMRYTLRRADGGAVIARDRKTGFCLGDRYEAARARTLANSPRRPVYVGECGRGKRALRRVREGISVGYGDDYKPTLEGQYVEVTGLAAGRYELVHRVNEDRKIRERSFANNASSMLLELAWPQGGEQPPSVTVLARCGTSARCSAADGRP